MYPSILYATDANQVSFDHKDSCTCYRYITLEGALLRDGGQPDQWADTNADFRIDITARCSLQDTSGPTNTSLSYSVRLTSDYVSSSERMRSLATQYAKVERALAKLRKMVGADLSSEQALLCEIKTLLGDFPVYMKYPDGKVRKDTEKVSDLVSNLMHMARSDAHDKRAQRVQTQAEG